MGNVLYLDLGMGAAGDMLAASLFDLLSENEREEFLSEMAFRYKDKIAVGVDIKDGYVAIKGWTEKSQITADEMFESLLAHSISRVICTDISRDGAMKGTNLELYKELSSKFNIDIIASGGVTDMNDVEKLAEMDIYGAILGKAIYTGNIDLKTAIKAATK
jgi:phosphoribosylformimino-5-aminoimidazole carboxamide ribotide isomerase